MQIIIIYRYILLLKALHAGLRSDYGEKIQNMKKKLQHIIQITLICRKLVNRIYNEFIQHGHMYLNTTKSNDKMILKTFSIYQSCIKRRFRN